MNLAVTSTCFHQPLSAGQMHLWDVPGEARVLGLPYVELQDCFLPPAAPGLLQNLLHRFRLPSPALPDRKYDRRQIRRIGRALHYYNMALAAWSCQPSLGLPEQLPQARAYVRLALQTASQLGASILCLTVDHQAIAHTISPVVDTLSLLVVDAERLNIRLAVEPDDVSAHADRLLGVLQGVNSPWLGVCLRFGSLLPEHSSEDFELLAPHAIHVRANSLAFDAYREETTVLYSYCVGVLKTLRYTGAIAIEYTGNASPAEGVQQMRRLIEKYWY